MHIADVKGGNLGANGVVGGGLATAMGVGLGLKMQKREQIVLCFFGDGAANLGPFHESLNMAAIWDLPVVYVCENNQYAMSTHVSASMAIDTIADRAAAYGFPGVTADGNDVNAVRAAAVTACKRARTGEGPTLLECKTYRLSGHSRGDLRAYRTREEEAYWKAHDPIPRLRRELLRSGALTAARDRAIRREVREIVRDAVAFARRAPDPDPAGLTEGVYP